MTRIFLLGLGLIAFGNSAWAHGEYQWIQDRDRRMEESCCGEHDCHKVQVEFVPGGYAFRYADFSYSVRYDQARASEDGAYWACIPRPGALRCFFAPPMGS